MAEEIIYYTGDERPVSLSPFETITEIAFPKPYITFALTMKTTATTSTPSGQCRGNTFESWMAMGPVDQVWHSGGCSTVYTDKLRYEQKKPSSAGKSELDYQKRKGKEWTSGFRAWRFRLCRCFSRIQLNERWSLGIFWAGVHAGGSREIGRAAGRERV